MAAKPARSRRTLTRANLIALGVERLADLALELADEQPVVKRRLRLELAAATGPDVLAAEIDKHLLTLAGGRARIPWRRYRALVADLELQRRTIVVTLAAEAPGLAFDVLGRFLGMADDILRRVNDSRGDAEAVFLQAAEDLGGLVPGLDPDPGRLADFALKALSAMEPRLALLVLNGLIQGLDATALSSLRPAVAALDPRGATAKPHLRLAAQMLADAAGDVEGFACTLSPRELASPWGAAQVASRLIAGGQHEEALRTLAAGAPPGLQLTPPYGKGLPPLLRQPGGREWLTAYEAGLEATGEGDNAQALRWSAFETAMSGPHLRAYLKRLGGFDDVVAEDRALALAAAHPDATMALQFLTDWPALSAAANLVSTRASDLDGGKVEILEAASEALEGRFPLSAVMIRRAIVEAAIRRRPPDWRDLVARQVAANEHLETQVADWDEIEPPGEFRARMRRAI